MTSETCDLPCPDLPKAEATRQGLPTLANLEPAAAVAEALSDPMRLAVALALANGGRACVRDLGWVTGTACSRPSCR